MSELFHVLHDGDQSGPTGPVTYTLAETRERLEKLFGPPTFENDVHHSWTLQFPGTRVSLWPYNSLKYRIGGEVGVCVHYLACWIAVGGVPRKRQRPLIREAFEDRLVP